MKKMRSMKRITLFLAALCIMISMSVTVFATENETSGVAEAREGVLEINLVYVDPNGDEYPLKHGSGFLIGASTGATTVITNHHVITLSKEEKDSWREIFINEFGEEFAVDFYNTNISELKIQVVVKRDVVIEATYVNGSATTDFAILELSQAIHDRKPLKLSDSDKLFETQEVYALGFPWLSSAVQDDKIYTSEDVTFTNGIVGKLHTTDGIKFILHNVQLGAGNSGGPLVNKNGDVVGVNRSSLVDATTLINPDEYYRSIAINEVRSVLDALGIYYETDEGTTDVIPESSETVIPEEPATPSEPVTPSEPTEQVTPVTPSEPSEPAGPVTPSEPEKNNTMLIVGAVAAVAVIGIVIAIVMMNKNKKTPAGGSSANQIHQPIPPYQSQTPNIPPMPMDTGAGETSVLGAGAGETSVLGGGMQPQATLIRKKNGEKAVITSSLFTIGKERQKVNFCIPDNNSISRTHAKIMCKGGVFYVVDNNSTNYTFVNGNKINPGQEVKLNSGDKIKLADEEFEFRL